ncbi:MAG TPA: Rad52/Rad22 family DNA repair protein [Gemmataceae bacterium]|nr:Rad52/Rad22 family DNA repair protein [Gemmataceae bacterium]
MRSPAKSTANGTPAPPESVSAPHVAADVEAIMKALAAPFDLTEVKFKPAVVSGNRALALAYVDARVIQDRLDEVLGVTGWQDDYECLPDGSVVCRLRLKVGGEWLTKVDVGGPSEQPDEGDRRKAAFSDALKRAAVKFGVGRYLYRLASQWVDYDPKRRQFARTPSLPDSALPVRARTERAQPAPASQPPEPTASARKAPAPKPAAAKTVKMPGHGMPANGAELQKRLHDYDARLAAQGLCRPGELVQHVVQAGVQAGHNADLATWSGPAIALAVDETRAFEAQVRQRPGEHKDVA